MPDRPDSLPERLRAFALILARRGGRLRLAPTAASLSFLSLLALVPIFTIAISLLGALPAFDGARDATLKFLASNLFLPSFSDTLVRYLNEFAAKSTELSLLGAILFFAAAFTVVLTIDRTLNRIWHTGQLRPFASRMTIYWTFLTLGPLLLAATMTVNGMLVTELLSGVSVPALGTLWPFVLPWLSSILGLTLLYRIVPNAPVRWRDALVGALVAAVVLELIKRGMAFQVAILPTYTVVYGAFAALPLFLVWLFLLWFTVLGGAMVAANLGDWGAADDAVRAPTPATRFERAAAVLDALAANAAEGRSAVAASTFRDLFAGRSAPADETARLIASLGYIERLWRLPGSAPGSVSRDSRDPVWDETWMLAQGAGARTLRPLFECLWRTRSPASVDVPERFDLDRIDRPLQQRATRTGSCPSGSP